MSSKDLSDVVSNPTLANTALGMQGTGVALSGVGAYNKAIADRAAYESQAAVSGNNAILADAQARDALSRGQTAEVNSRLRTRQLKGQQIAQMAANGLDLSEGSPLSILTDTDFMGENDAAVIRQNALKEAWGYGVQAQNYRGNADLLRFRAGMESPGRSAATSLLTGTGSVAASWYNMRKAGAGL